MSDSKWNSVGKLNEFPNGKMQCLEVAGQSVLFCRMNDQIHALLNKCSHLGLDMHRGRFMGGELVCPHHGACFDVTTGKPESGPAVFPLTCYETKIENGEVFVRL